MQINSESLLTLDANKSYYIANSTGEIKEAGLWQRFKCFTGLGDGREKVQRLADQVKAALLKDGGIRSEAKLTSEIDQLDLTTSISGDSLRAIASRFRADNVKNVSRADMERLAESEAESFVDRCSDPADLSSYCIHPDSENVGFMKQLAAIAAKSVLIGREFDADTDRTQLKQEMADRMQAMMSTLGELTDKEGKHYVSAPCFEMKASQLSNARMPSGSLVHYFDENGPRLPVLDKTTSRVVASSLFTTEGKMRSVEDAANLLKKFPPEMLTGNVGSVIRNAAKVPMDLVRKCNESFLGSVGSSVKCPYSEGQSRMVDPIVNRFRKEMADRYGEALAGTTLSPLNSGADMRAAVEKATSEGRLVEARDIEDIIHKQFNETALDKFVLHFAAKVAEQAGMPKPRFDFIGKMNTLHPDMRMRISAAETHEAAEAVIKEYEGAMKTLMATMKSVRAMADGVADKAIALLAEKTGMTKEDAAQLNTDALNRKVKQVGEAIIAGTHPGCKEAGFSVEREFEKLIEKFVGSKAKQLETIDGIPDASLNADGKEAFRQVVLRTEKTDRLNIGGIIGMVNDGTVTSKHFKEFLSAEGDVAIAQGLLKVSQSLYWKFSEVHGGEESMQDMGAEERDAGYEMILKKLFSDDKDLAKLFQSQRDKLESWASFGGDASNHPLGLSNGVVDPTAVKLLSIIYRAILTD